MDWKAVAAFMGMIISGALWGARVEYRLTASERMTVEATANLACQLRQYGNMLNWVGNSVEAISQRRPLPSRPLVFSCEG